MQTEVFDCQVIEGSTVLKKELLLAVRRLFTEARELEFRDWNSDCDDECLFVYSRRKYHPSESEETATAKAQEEFWAWRHRGGKVPVHLCSYFNRAVKGKKLLFA